MLGLVFIVMPALSYVYLKNGLDYYTDRLDELEYLGEAPKFSLINQLGDTMTVADMNGKMTVIGYFSANCGNDCDTMLYGFQRIQEAFPDNYNINLLSYSADSVQLDLPNNEADGSKWFWLKGDKVVFNALFKNGFKMPVENGYSTQFALVDTSRNIRRYYDALDYDEVNRLVVHLAMTAPRPPKRKIKFEREKEK